MNSARDAAGPAPIAPTAPDHGADALVGLLQKEGLVADAQLRYATRVRAKLDGQASLLKVLQDLDIIKPEHIRQAVRANPKSVRLGDLLIELGHLRDADLRAALAAQAAATERRKLGEILVESHFITEQKLTDVLGDLLGIEAVEPRVSEIEPTLLAHINLRMCQECVLIPVAERDGSVTVA